VILNRIVYRIFRLLGWRFEGGLPPDPKVIVIGAPHTSNWDFLAFMAAMGAFRIRPRYLGKHSLFRWPFGIFFRALGGIPVDRRKPGGVVGQVVEEFAGAERMVLVLAPEGTRGSAEKWKSGFIAIAKAAGVPVVPGVLDFGRKTIRLADPVRFEGDVNAFMDRIRTAYAGATGRRPQGQGPIRVNEED
jgi:1-acyl-sn-glycerol-3-phosphate acyltransferase